MNTLTRPHTCLVIRLHQLECRKSLSVGRGDWNCQEGREKAEKTKDVW